MSNKQTAIDWLYSQITFNGLDDIDGQVFEQAKAMEKEQTIEFANKVLYNAECSFTGRAYLEKSINEYYKETYE